MRPTTKILGSTLICAVLAAAPATAADKCFLLPGLAGGVEFALESFSLPSKGRCKPVTGLSTPLAGFVLSGTACTQSDGSGLRLVFTGYPVIDPGPVEFRAGCTLPLPTLTGGTCRGTYDTVGAVPRIAFTSSISLAPCVATVP